MREEIEKKERVILFFLWPRSCRTDTEIHLSGKKYWEKNTQKLKKTEKKPSHFNPHYSEKKRNIKKSTTLILIFSLPFQTVTSSSPMPKWRTSPSSSVTMVSVTCAGTRGLRSCRSRARATCCTARSPRPTPYGRSRRRSRGPRRNKSRCSTTRKTVSFTRFYQVFIVMSGLKLDDQTVVVIAGALDKGESFFFQDIVKTGRSENKKEKGETKNLDP